MCSVLPTTPRREWAPLAAVEWVHLEAWDIPEGEWLEEWDSPEGECLERGRNCRRIFGKLSASHSLSCSMRRWAKLAVDFLCWVE